MSPVQAVRFGRQLGSFLYHVIPIRRRVAFENLQHAFPDKNTRQINRIIKRTYQNFGQTFTDFLRTPVRTKKELQQRVRMKNVNVLNRVMQNPKGVVFLSGHYGNWEIMAAAISAHGCPLTVLARTQRNKRVDALVNSYRKIAGIETFPLGLAVRAVLRTLRAGRAVALLADQDAHKEGIFVPFFGRPAATAPGPALFILKTGAPFIFAECKIDRNGGYSVWFTPIKTQDLDGISQENIKTLTGRHVKLLEEKIRLRPDHWFWMHKRWKTKPSN